MAQVKNLFFRLTIAVRCRQLHGMLVRGYSVLPRGVTHGSGEAACTSIEPQGPA